MKEHFQDYGVRRWAGDDLIELQAEPLEALQRLVEPYAPCIIQGCGVNMAEKRIEPGLVALWLLDGEKKRQCVKIARFGGCSTTNLPVYLTLKCSPETRVYADGESKVIANSYTAQESILWEEVKDMYPLTITETGGTRLPDNISVNFAPATERENIESGERLPILFGKIKKWLKDLGTLAFKNKVAETDLETTLGNKLNVQADWNEKNTDNRAFIKNKPTSLPANGGTAQTISSILPLAKGGTGETTAAAAAGALLNGLGPGNSIPADNANIVISGNGTTTYYKKPLTLLWNWIKSKLKTVATSGSYNDLTDRPPQLDGETAWRMIRSLGGKVCLSTKEGDKFSSTSYGRGGYRNNSEEAVAFLLQQPDGWEVLCLIGRTKASVTMKDFFGNYSDNKNIFPTGDGLYINFSNAKGGLMDNVFLFTENGKAGIYYRTILKVPFTYSLNDGIFDASTQAKVKATCFAPMLVAAAVGWSPAATTAADGFMSAADKTKLNGIAAGAQVNPAYATAAFDSTILSSTDGYYQTGACDSGSYNNSVGKKNTVARGDHQHSLFIANATTSKPGLMSKADKTNLDLFAGTPKVIYACSFGVKDGNVSKGQEKAIPGVSVSLIYRNDNGQYVQVTTNQSLYTHIIPIITGQSAAPAFFDGNTGKGSFKIRLRHGTSDVMSIGGATFVLIGI